MAENDKNEQVINDSEEIDKVREMFEKASKNHENYEIRS